jgi:hypothetical protein
MNALGVENEIAVPEVLSLLYAFVDSMPKDWDMDDGAGRARDALRVVRKAIDANRRFSSPVVASLG